MTTTKIVVSIPTIDGHVSGWTFASVMGLLPNPAYLTRLRQILVDEFDIKYPASSSRKVLYLLNKVFEVLILDTWMWDYDLVRTRSRAVHDFLTKTDGTHLLFVDSDVAFDPSVIPRLVGLGLDCVSLPYPKRHIHWNRAYEASRAGRNPESLAYEYVMRTIEDKPLAEGDLLLEVEGVGMGCTLLSRAMLETMTRDADAPITFDREERIKYLFMLQAGIMANNPHVFGEDLSFCNRWRELGGHCYLYIGPGSPAHHLGLHLFRGSREGFNESASRGSQKD